MFDQYIKVRGQEFLEELDVWFSTNDKSNMSKEMRKGTGLYMVHYVETEEDKISLRDLLTTRGEESE